MSTHTLRQRREPIITELRQIRDAAGDGLTPEQQTKVDELRASLAAIDKQIGLAELIEHEELSMPGRTLAGGGGDAFETLAAQVTASDVLRAQLPGVTDAGAGRAREVSAELARRSGRQPEGLLFSMQLSGVRPRPEQRAFTTIAPGGGPGSNLIQTDVAPYMIDRLREKVVVRGLGATVLSGLQGNLAIPRLKASTTGYWVADGVAVTESDPQVDQVPLAPHHVGGMTEFSRNMILQPSIDVAQMIEADLAKIIAVALDQAALVGGGAGQPNGLLAAGSGINAGPSLGATGGVPSWANLIALIGLVDQSNALAGSLGWATNAKTVKLLRATLKTPTDTASNMLMSEPNVLAGYPLASSQNVPANLSKSTSGNVLSALIFGDWSMLVLGFWSELDLLLNPFDSVAYPKGSVMVRAMATADVAIRQPLAFAASVEINAP
jgi:HK97 family phage major capsid protein